jgi:UDP-arabinose 4-epimerase
VTPHVLVTGGAGYIGSHVCRALAASGTIPVTVDNFSTGNPWAVRWGPLERGDVGDLEFLNSVFARYRVQAVMHLAGSALAGEGERRAVEYWRNNVSVGIALLQAMAAAGVRRLVFSSSCSLYGQPGRTPVDEGLPIAPISVYGRSKAAFESVLADTAAQGQVDYVALRYFNAAGAAQDGQIGEWHQPETHLIPNILLAIRDATPLSVFGTDYDTADGTCIRDYVHVEDIADAHLAAFAHLTDGAASHAVNIGSGQGYSIREVIQSCERVTGSRVQVRPLPRRPGDPARLFADSRRAHELLGWTPRRTQLDDIIRSAWHWLQSGEAIRSA